MINHYNFTFAGLDPELTRLNSDILKKIVIEKASHTTAPEELKKIERLVSLATAVILKDINPYTSGSKKLTDRQVIEIGNEFDKIKARVEARVKQREDYLANNAHALMAMVSRLRSRQVDLADRESVSHLFNDYYQIMGYTVAYGRWKKGDEIVGPHPSFPNYEVQEIIKNSKGLQIVVLTPKGKGPDGISLPPIFCCRGSLPANSNSIIDDLNSSIGQYSLPDSQQQIEETLKTVTEKYGAAVLTGHSLGGMVTITLTGEGDMKSVKIKPDCVDKEDIEGLELLIKTAYADAQKKLKDNAPPGLGGLQGLFG